MLVWSFAGLISSSALLVIDGRTTFFGYIGWKIGRRSCGDAKFLFLVFSKDICCRLTNLLISGSTLGSWIGWNEGSFLKVKGEF